MIFESLNSNLDFQNLQASFNNNFIPSSQESTNPNSIFEDNTFGHILQERTFNENSLLNPTKELPLAGLAVYVEVMSNETNISRTCYQYLEKLGAKIEKRMNRKCNLVIWKDGSLKTIEKAKEYNVTVVNSLWLEDCTENFHLAPYEKFLPELPSETDMPFLCFRNKMMKKQKSFEPNFEGQNFVVEDKENAGMRKPSTHKGRKINFEKHSDEKKRKKGRRFDCKKNLSPLFDTSPFKTQFFSQQEAYSESFTSPEKPFFLTQPQKTLPVVNESHLEEDSKNSLIKPSEQQKPQEDEAYDLKKVKNMILKYVSSYRLGSSGKKAREEPCPELQKSSAKKHLSMKSSAQKDRPSNTEPEVANDEEEEREEGEDLNKSLSLALSKLQPLVNLNGKRSASSELSSSSNPSDTDLDEQEANEFQVKSNPSKKIKIAKKEPAFETKPILSYGQPQIEEEEETHFTDFNSPVNGDIKNQPKSSSVKKRYTKSPFVEDKIVSEAKSTAPKSTCSRINSVAKNLTMAIENDENVQITDDNDEEYHPIVKRRKKTTRRKRLNVQKVLRELAENDESEGKAKLDELDSRDIVLLLKEMINNDLKGDDSSVHQEEEELNCNSPILQQEEEGKASSEGQVLTFKIQCHAFSDFDFDEGIEEEEQLVESPYQVERQGENNEPSQLIVVESDADKKIIRKSELLIEVQNNESIINAGLGDTVILSIVESQKSESHAEERSEQSIKSFESANEEVEKSIEDQSDAFGFESARSESQGFFEGNLDSPSDEPEPVFEEENSIHQESTEDGIKANSKLLFTHLSMNGMTQARQFCKQHNFQLVEEKICNIPQAEFIIYDGEDLPPTFAIVYALLNKKPLIRSDWLVVSLFKNELQNYQEYLIKFDEYPKKELFSNTLFYVDKELDKPMKSMISKREITTLVEGLGGLIVEDLISCDYYITKQPVKKRKDVPANVKTIKPQWIIDKIIEGNRGNNPLY